MTAGARRGEAGFSLVELLIAVTITLIVSGAVFGLMASGQAAFRREPALTDRQQNIRVALDLIVRDASQAGMGMGALLQAFSNNLDGFGPAGLPSVIRAGSVPDAIEIFANDGNCPTLDVCAAQGSVVRVIQRIPACYGMPGLVYVGNRENPTAAGIHYAVKDPPGTGGCGETQLNFPHGRAPQWNPSGGFCKDSGQADPCEILSKISVIRYEIAPDGDGAPSLWRSPTGRSDVTGLITNIPPGDPRPESNWQVVARGIEDLQVEYMNGGGSWAPTPGAVTCAGGCTAPSLADWNTVVRQVKVTLSARALERNLQGETTSAQGSAVRGQLSAVVAPRAAHVALQRANTGLWR